MPEENILAMSFDPNTIEHLGVRMYSQIPTAIAELVANSYDADAKNVVISLYDNGDKKIIVQDDGIGMTFDEINKYFLKIGRNRRDEGQIKSPSGRTMTGKKGLGKLALFGIGDTIEVTTVKKGEMVQFRMNWQDLKNTKESNYTPQVISRKECDDKPGTTITLSDLKRKSPFDVEDLAISLSKLFSLFDNSFKVIAKKDGVEISVDNNLKYSNLDEEFRFSFPNYLKKIEEDYPSKDEISGAIITTEKPLKPEMRGITLFANGRLVNSPEFFGRSESSHFYSYVTGWLDVDFVDNWKEDVISTNRQSLNWDLDNTKALRDFLQTILSEIQKDWREERKQKRRKTLTEKLKIDIGEWYGKLPSDIQPKVESIVDSIEKSELSSDNQTNTVANIHALIPEYPYYHWRHLHKEIRSVSSKYYENQNYYGAFLESVKKYINAVRQKSGVGHEPTEDDLMAKAFHHNSGSLTVTSNYRRTNGSEFSPDTLENIQQGQFHFSKGVIAGGRHPVAHEEIRDLRESGLFSEKDCLDLLSLLSHLHSRLDNAKLKTP
jgi:uncharacterized protein (TIGR02391 family)